MFESLPMKTQQQWLFSLVQKVFLNAIKPVNIFLIDLHVCMNVFDRIYIYIYIQRFTSCLWVLIITSAVDVTGVPGSETLFKATVTFIVFWKMNIFLKCPYRLNTELSFSFLYSTFELSRNIGVVGNLASWTWTLKVMSLNGLVFIKKNIKTNICFVSQPCRPIALLTLNSFLLPLALITVLYREFKKPEVHCKTHIFQTTDIGTS